MNDFAVVAIGYNRPDCMLRLLTSLNQADYCGDIVPLIISIDNSGSDSVLKAAEEFKWNHGEKFIKIYPERLGLKKHILTCGDLTQQYQNIAVFEDDIYASESYYRYAKQAAEFYMDDDRIAGIALYSHLWNVGCNRPFLSINDQYDVYFMQYACSWGQVWSKEKWNKFITWYNENNNERILYSPSIPENVVKWSNSWLKYHIKYCIETNKFFVYPKVGHSTNFSSSGQHNLQNSNGFQVPLQVNSKNYYFPRFDESCVKYDAFFEFCNIGNYINLNNEDICVDLYGMKRNKLEKRYWLTLEQANYKIVQSFDLSLRPHEMNVMKCINGNIIKLYDTRSIEINEKETRYNLLKLNIDYDIRNISFKAIFIYTLITLSGKLKGKFLRRGKD